MINLPEQFKLYIDTIPIVQVTNLAESIYDDLSADWNEEEYEDWMDYFSSYYGDDSIHWSQTFDYFFQEFLDIIDPLGEIEYDYPIKKLCIEQFNKYLVEHK